MATSHDQQGDLLSSQVGLANDVSIETRGQLGQGEETVRARGYWEQVWRRFRRDKVAVASGALIIFIIVGAIFGGPIAAYLLGHGPNDLFTNGVDPNTFLPVGPMTHVSYVDAEGHTQTTLLILGGDSTLGRDEFLRLLYGARLSLQVALIATFFTVLFGVIAGAAAGYFGGWIDIVISRLTEIVMAFPVLLFTVALSGTVGPRLNDITFGIFNPGVVTLVVVLTVFGWFYIARIVRGLVLSLREKEFIEAARMVGAGHSRIIRSHLLPHLVAPIIVYSTLIIAQMVLAEAGLSFLGLGIPLPTASWGNLLASAPEYYTNQPWLMIWPGLSVLIVVLAFNLLGDGLRDAFDPRSTR